MAVVLTGSLQLARHAFADALASGERTRAIAPRSAIVYGIIGDAAVELGRYDEAIAALQTMVDLRPDLASYSRIAYVRELHGDLPGAIDAMQRAVNAGAPGAEGTNWSRIQLGHLYFLTGDLDAADREHGLAPQLLPGYVHAVAGKGRGAAARGDLKGAIERYRSDQEITPLPEYVIALGDLYRTTGDEAGAARQDDLVRVIAQLQQQSGMDVDLEMALFEADRATSPPALEGTIQKARAIYDRRRSVLAADVLAWTIYRAGRAPRRTRAPDAGPGEPSARPNVWCAPSPSSAPASSLSPAWPWLSRRSGSSTKSPACTSSSTHRPPTAAP